jgi:hypothetical protein
MTTESMKSLVEEVGEAIDKMHFKLHDAPPPGCKAYEGEADGWKVMLVVLLDAKPNQRNTDGAATRMVPIPLTHVETRLKVRRPTAAPLIVRLTPELAAKAQKIAERQMQS